MIYLVIIQCQIIHPHYIIHHILNIRMSWSICKLNVLGIQCQPLPVILAVQKQSVMLFDIANYIIYIITVINTLLCVQNLHSLHCENSTVILLVIYL